MSAGPSRRPDGRSSRKRSASSGARPLMQRPALRGRGLPSRRHCRQGAVSVATSAARPLPAGG
eukprot:1934140-Lingulodinium_polyedra.AAC.1